MTHEVTHGAVHGGRQPAGSRFTLCAHLSPNTALASLRIRSASVSRAAVAAARAAANRLRPPPPPPLLPLAAAAAGAVA